MMKRLTLLFLSYISITSCGGASPVAPSVGASDIEAPAFAKAAQPTYTCANADAQLGSLVTLVQHATHVQAPATEAVLLPLLRTAHASLIANPCDKQGALAAMAAFNTAVDAKASTITAAQVTVFHAVANRVISSINQVP
jgi:hypothetical protein